MVIYLILVVMVLFSQVIQRPIYDQKPTAYWLNNSLF